MEEKAEARLVADALAGSGEAFATLVRRYQEYAYGVAVGLLTDFELARDVVQEAFLAAYRDLGKLQEPHRFGGWLRGIVRHKAFRALRDLERVRGLTEELTKAEYAPAPSRRPDQTAEEEERRRIVSEALQRLSERNREVVGLYYVNGLSYADIAGFLNVTETAVQGRLQRARAQLREELTVVEETFEREELTEDFTAEISRLLEEVAAPRTRSDDHVRQSRKRDRGRAVKRLQEIGAPAVDPLCEALEDPRGAVRLTALRALCLLGDSRAKLPVVRLLQAKDVWLCWKLFVDGHVLSIPGVPEAFLQIALEGKGASSSSARVAPAMAIQALGHAKSTPELVQQLTTIYRDGESYHRHLRAEALGALCSLQPEAALDWLSQGLVDDDARVRSTAAYMAVSRDLLPPLEICLQGLDKEGGWWGRSCLALLVAGHGESGIAALERIVTTGDGVMRCAAALALARTGSTGAFDVLTEELLGMRSGPGGSKLRRAVSGTLARGFGDLVVSWVEADRERLTTFPSVMWTLAKTPRLPEAGTPAGGVPLGEMVETMSKEAPPALRHAAVRLLARQRGTEYLPQLRQALAAARPRKVAQEAFHQMLRMGERALPATMEMLESKHWGERKAAVCLLRRWGKLTPEIRARAETDDHIAVRHAATQHISRRRAPE
ncbi:sigma-70 family RNA polymerase sigma factor [Candidatus Latescibacterota bacterium]